MPWCVVVLFPDGRAPFVKIPVEAAQGESAILDAMAAAGIVQSSGVQGFAFLLTDSSTVAKKTTVAYATITNLAEILPT